MSLDEAPPARPPAPVPWPEWESHAARELWRDGKSGAIIAKRLGTNRSRRAVMSRLRKMGELGNPARRITERFPHSPPPIQRPRAIPPGLPVVISRPWAPHWRFVADAVVDASNITMKQILGPAKARKIVAARHALMWLMRKYCRNATTPLIGERLRRDHTTVLWALTHVNNLLTEPPNSTDPKAKAVKYIIENVKARIRQHDDHGTDQD